MSSINDSYTNGDTLFRVIYLIAGFITGMLVMYTRINLGAFESALLTIASISAFGISIIMVGFLLNEFV